MLLHHKRTLDLPFLLSVFFHFPFAFELTSGVLLCVMLTGLAACCRSDAGWLRHDDHKRSHYNHCWSHWNSAWRLGLQIHFGRLEPTACQHWACAAE